MMSILNFKPLADRVLVEPDAMQDTTLAGIFIPDTAKEKPQQGVVVARGAGTKNEEMILKKGDHVLFAKYSGTEVVLDDKKYLVMKQSDVYGILQSKEKSQSVKSNI